MATLVSPNHRQTPSYEPHHLASKRGATGSVNMSPQEKNPPGIHHHHHHHQPGSASANPPPSSSSSSSSLQPLHFGPGGGLPSSSILPSPSTSLFERSMSAL
ncbi:hypothetical protein HK101_005729, partial [Irineochytrium annulatum]